MGTCVNVLHVASWTNRSEDGPYKFWISEVCQYRISEMVLVAVALLFDLVSTGMHGRCVACREHHSKF